jgi:hypothetical protein
VGPDSALIGGETWLENSAGETLKHLSAQPIIEAQSSIGWEFLWHGIAASCVISDAVLSGDAAEAMRPPPIGSIATDAAIRTAKTARAMRMAVTGDLLSTPLPRQLTISRPGVVNQSFVPQRFIGL